MLLVEVVLRYVVRQAVCEEVHVRQQKQAAVTRVVLRTSQQLQLRRQSLNCMLLQLCEHSQSLVKFGGLREFPASTRLMETCMDMCSHRCGTRNRLSSSSKCAKPSSECTFLTADEPATGATAANPALQAPALVLEVRPERPNPRSREMRLVSDLENDNYRLAIS